MPHRIVDESTGAVLFRPTEEEKQMRSLVEKYTDLETKYNKLEECMSKLLHEKGGE